MTTIADAAQTPTLPPLTMPLEAAMRTQRALRRLRPDPVDDAMVLRLIELVLKAPIGRNVQNWEFVLVHDVLRFFQLQRRGEKQRIFEKSKAPFRMLLAFVSLQSLPGRQGAFVQLIRGQNNTTVLHHQGLTGQHRRGQRPFDLVHLLVRKRCIARPSPLRIAGGGVDRRMMDMGRRQVLHKGAERLLRIGFTHKRRTAEFLEGFDFIGTLFE
jgi:Nitroreductase family